MTVFQPLRMILGILDADDSRVLAQRLQRLGRDRHVRRRRHVVDEQRPVQRVSQQPMLHDHLPASERKVGGQVGHDCIGAQRR